ncbi:MAG: ABC transporter ATP-binding protein [Bacteroidota bacterium]
MKSLSALNKYFLRHKFSLAAGTAFVILSNLFALFPAQIVRHSFDYIIDSIHLYFSLQGAASQKELYSVFAAGLLMYGLLIVFMALMRGLFLFLMRQTLIVMSRKIEFDQKNDIYAHYQSLPLSFYRNHNTGDLMARISEDVSRVRMYTGPAIMYGINLVTVFVLVIGYMLSVNVRLTVLSLLPLPLLSFSIYYVNRIIEKRSEQIQRSLSDLSTFTQEAFSGIRVLKAFVREKDNAEKFTVESNLYRMRNLQLANVNALFFPLMMGLIGLSTILTVYVGGTEVMNGNITTGNIAEFVIYITMLTWPVTALGWTISMAQRAAASQTRINEFLDTKTDIVSSKNLVKDIKGDVRFENVAFTYEDSGIEALKGVTLDVKAGQSLAIMGATGTGKSTIANLLARMMDPTGGRITIDGNDLRDYDLHILRTQMAQVPQDVFLFSDSIRNNIAFGADTLPPESEILAAAAHADLSENLSRFPEGLDTKIGERGITLSGGQKQRVSIARALILNPRILVLDDCLSAVDTNTENAILGSLRILMEDKTTIIISHRISSAKLADKIAVLSDGQIAEMGTHESLIQAGGLYRELYEKQLAAEMEEGGNMVSV